MESLLDSMTVTLSRPFEINGVTVETITVREPKLRDRILFSKDKGDAEEKTARMLARLANLNIEDIYSLPSCDYMKMEEAFNELVKIPTDRKQIL
ncbi:TPA: phage tail assembly protein [Escherichia coli]|uniref:phage tail assembly protein n=1 Tax=Escherichia coli TaxID=562 RepID=UPI00022440A2|nr:phage tail assembly protein [Escherichia coli]EES3796557.1 phage tail assembly protein [Escherichia coli]EFC9842899.1 phage tail assembly protein [Escherichia coli]EFG2177004.1 phage tail assembly protein [Escherichia coli]EFJ5712515.1 phage tail assembly protein [Escherichia coli]EFK1930350.1 phage tail assembly protein [Escherichia coli]